MPVKIFIHRSKPKYESGVGNYFNYFLLFKREGAKDYTQIMISEYYFFVLQLQGVPEEKNY